MPTVFDDGAFTVDKGDWGYQSFTREGDKVVLSMSEWECVMWTRAWLKAQQDGIELYRNFFLSHLFSIVLIIFLARINAKKDYCLNNLLCKFLQKPSC